MKTIVAATRNKHKIEEIGAITGRFGMEIISRDEAGIPPVEIPETGKTFEENSYIKAYEIMKLCGQITVADDSGLVVDCLDGAPGVYSARWAGETASDSDLIAKLLHEMRNVPDGKRQAHFACVMCLAAPGGEMQFFEGRVEGEILRESRGENGFGYDPVFGYQGRSFAEIPAAEKNAVSHRYNALVQVTEWLRQTVK